MATQDDLVRAVLLELVVVGGSDTIDNNDSADVKKKYLSVHRDLARKFMVDWAETSDIPDDALEPMTLLVAYRSARQFGRVPDAEMWREGMARLYDYRNTPWLPTPQMRTVYF